MDREIEPAEQRIKASAVGRDAHLMAEESRSIDPETVEKRIDETTLANISRFVSMDISTDVDPPSNFEDVEAEVEDENIFLDGFSFVVLTIGLMAVVLILALDNYIIGLF